MDTKEILSLNKNQSTLSLAKSHLQTSVLTNSEKETLELFIISIYDYLKEYDELIKYGNLFLENKEDLSENYCDILAYMFNAALKLNEFNLAKTYLEKRKKHIKPINTYLVLDEEIRLAKTMGKSYEELIKNAINSGIPSNYQVKYLDELVALNILKEDYLLASEYLELLKGQTNRKYPREELLINLKLKKYETAEELSNEYIKDELMGKIPSILTKLEIYIIKKKYRLAVILETSNLDIFEDAMEVDQLKFYDLCRTLYKNLDNHLSFDEYDTKYKRLEQKLKREEKKEEKKLLNVQEKIEKEYKKESKSKEILKPIEKKINLTSEKASEILNDLYEIFMFSENISEKLSFRDYLRTLFIYIENYYKICNATLLIDRIDVYYYKDERLYDKKIIPEKITNTPHEFILSKGETIKSKIDDYKLYNSIYTHKEFSNNIKQLVGFPLTKDSSFVVYLDNLVNIDNAYLFFKNISALIYSRINRERKLSIFRKENQFLVSILNSNLGAIRTLSRTRAINNEEAQILFNVNKNDYIDSFIKNIHYKDVSRYRDSLSKLFQKEGQTLEIEYLYNNKNIKEKMVSIRDFNKIKIVSLFIDQTECVYKYELALKKSITDSLTKIYNTYHLKQEFPKLLNEKKVTFILINLNMDSKYLYTPDEIENYIREFSKITDDYFIDGTLYRLNYNEFLVVVMQNDIRSITNLVETYLEFLNKYNVLSIEHNKFNVKIGFLRYPVTTTQKNPYKILRFLEIAKQKALNRSDINYYDFTYLDYEEEVKELQILSQINNSINNNKTNILLKQIIDIKKNTVYLYESEIILDNIDCPENVIKLIAKKRNRLIDLELNHIKSCLDFLVKLFLETNKIIKIIIPISLETLLLDNFYDFILTELKIRNLKEEFIHFKIDLSNTKDLSNYKIIDKLRNKGITFDTNNVFMVLNYPFINLHLNIDKLNPKLEKYLINLKNLLKENNQNLILRNITDTSNIEFFKSLDINYILTNDYPKLLPEELINQIKKLYN